MRAMRNAQLLNRNIPLKGKPMPWEDLETYIQIYSELPQTDARDQAIEMYKTAKIEKDMQAMMQPQAPVQDAQGGAMAMNMLSQQQQGQPAPSM